MMILSQVLSTSLLAFVSVALQLATGGEAARSSNNKVLLKNIQSLTLRKGESTSHRRVSAIPQLKCAGGNGCRYYEVDLLRCVNAGSDYDENNIQWTCKATLPAEFKLGSTDVRCEGYSSPQDPFILKGSCGVEYRLILTELGEQKYKGWDSYKPGRNSKGDEPSSGGFSPTLFWLLFVAVVLWMLYSAFRNQTNSQRGTNPRPPRPPRHGGGGGGGGGGWWGGGDDNDPPPPYTPGPPRKPSHQSQPGNGVAPGWQPGFWSGILGGAAGGYLAGRRTNRNEQQQRRQPNAFSPANFDNQRRGGWVNDNYNTGNPGEGSSSGRTTSSTYTSTGFGSTNNR